MTTEEALIWLEGYKQALIDTNSEQKEIIGKWINGKWIKPAKPKEK